jgi:GNAT superfamily N-acetyltransferase
MLAPKDRYVLKRLDPRSEAFAALLEESRLEGFWMLVRLRDGWERGSNRFRRRGEVLLAAWHGGALAGVGGLSVDPYAEGPRQGRLRHVYVSAMHRRRGVGRLLLKDIMGRAREHFPMLNVRAPETAFPFYEALGFKRVEGDEFVTHRMKFRKRRTPEAGVRP